MLKQVLKRAAATAITAAAGDSEGYVNLPVLRGPAKGMRLKLNLRSFIEPAYLLGSYERAEVALVSEILRPEWTVWDCGIYLGFYTALFAKACARVIAFEPDPANIKRTKENLRLNNLSNVSFVEAAIGPPHTRLEFCISSNTNSHLKTAFIGNDRDDYATREQIDEVIQVRSMSLDEALDEVPAPDLVKIDIEGAEGQALQYTERLCREVRPLVILELHNPECDQAAWEWAQRSGYSLKSIDTGKVVNRREDTGGTLFCTPEVAKVGN